MVGVHEILNVESGFGKQRLCAPVRMAAGGDVAVREVDKILQAAERRALAGVDVLEE